MPPTRLPLPDGLPRRMRRIKVLAVLIGVMLISAVYFLFRNQTPTKHVLRVTAGDPLGHRHALATVLAGEANLRGLLLQLVPTKGSTEALAQVADGRIDVALVQGGLQPHSEIRQVAVLIPEPLHILVRPELADRGIPGFRGKRLNLGPIGSGTRQLALETLARAGFQPEDYADRHESFSELRELPPDELPDAVFHVSSLTAPLAEWLIAERGFHLISISFAGALALRDRSLEEFVIPAYAYGVDPPMPAEPVRTVAPWMSLVTRHDVPAEPIIRLLESIFEGDFALRAELSGLEVEQVLKRREFSLHTGTTKYLNRNHPVITGELIEHIENLRSFIFSAVVAAFLVWRWYLGRNSVGFEQYFDQVTHIEQEALQLAAAVPPTADQIRQFERRLSRIKSEAIEQFSSGRLHGDDLLGSFLAHVADVRQCLQMHRESDRSLTGNT